MLLCLATSTYADPDALEWHPDLRLTVNFLRRSGAQVEYRYRAVPRTVDDVNDRPPEVLYVEVNEENRDVLLPFLTRLKQEWPTTTVLVGGLAGTLDHLRVLSAAAGVDGCVRGEPELTLLDVGARLAAGGPVTDLPGLADRAGPGRPRALLPDLDVLGTMALDGLDEVCGAADGPDRVGYLRGSRGCPCHCTFCGVPDVYRAGGGPPWRGRSPRLITSELAGLVAERGIRTFVFQDDNLIGPGRAGHDRARALAREITAAGLQVQFSACCTLAALRERTLEALMAAGLTRIGVSVEATDGPSLRLLGKGHRPDRIYPALRMVERLGLHCDINLIFFGPYTTLASVRENLRLLEQIRESRFLGYSDAFPFGRLRAFPWSRLAPRLTAEGLLDPGSEFARFRDPQVSTLVAFVSRLERLTRLTFKHRQPLGTSDRPAAGGAGGEQVSGDRPTSRDRPTSGDWLASRDRLLVGEAVRTWIGLGVLPDYVAAACDVLEAELSPDARQDALAELESSFAARLRPTVELIRAGRALTHAPGRPGTREPGNPVTMP